MDFFKHWKKNIYPALRAIIFVYLIVKWQREKKRRRSDNLSLRSITGI